MSVIARGHLWDWVFLSFAHFRSLVESRTGEPTRVPCVDLLWVLSIVTVGICMRRWVPFGANLKLCGGTLRSLQPSSP